MEDSAIIRLYWQRNPDAIAESRRKYGSYCFTIANNLLADNRDAEECVSDTFLGAWNAIPPHRPERLKLFLAKITRRVAFNCYQARSAQKRGGGELPLVLEELGECIPGGTDPEEQVLAEELQKSIQLFADGLPQREQKLFVARYFFTEPIEQIARDNGLTPNHTSVILSRIRRKLKAHLIKEGFCYEERRFV